MAASPGSAAVSSFTSSMTAAMQVLKCRRPAKSWVILRIVWCSLRKSAWAKGEVGAAGPWPVRPRTDSQVAHDQAVDPAEKAADSRHPVLLPIHVAVGRGGEKGIHARSVGSIAGDHIIRQKDHVALGFGHLGAVADDHTLAEEAGHRLA